MASRPYFSTPGAELAELILAGNKAAITEGRKHRTTKQVKAALAQVKAAPKPATTTGPTFKRLHVASTGKANTAALAQADKAADWATAVEMTLAEGGHVRSTEFWATYKALRATGRQLAAVKITV